MTENTTCKQHSGMCAEVENLKESDRDQWNAINAMKTRSVAMLTAVMMTLLGMIVNLIVTLVKSGILHP